jgi:opacity protein-like surface antigen
MRTHLARSELDANNQENTMKRVLMLAACVAALAATPAFASTEGAYLSGNGGVSFTPDLTLKSNTLGNLTEHTDTGYTFGGTAGYDYGNGWRVQLDSQYTRQKVSSLSGAATNGHVSSTSLILGAQKDLTEGTTVTPYVGAGIGLQNVGGQVNGYEGRAWKPAYQAEAGLRGDLSQNVSLYTEYRFSQSASASMDNGADLAHQHFSDHGLLAGLTYHIGQ